MKRRTDQLQRRTRALTILVIVGLVVSGATALPLQMELNWIASLPGADVAMQSDQPPAWAVWLVRIRSALADVGKHHPFLFYATDWLAFGHFVIAIAFVGAWRHPVRNRWLFLFGMIASVVVIPYALVCGEIRGIPLWWRLGDCAFGALAFFPFWLCYRWTGELEQSGALAHDIRA